jgi:hypothetical protein
MPIKPNNQLIIEEATVSGLPCPSSISLMLLATVPVGKLIFGSKSKSRAKEVLATVIKNKEEIIFVLILFIG